MKITDLKVVVIADSPVVRIATDAGIDGLWREAAGIAGLVAPGIGR